MKFKERNPLKATTTTDIILVCLGLTAFAYTVVRAYFLSFTWDESWSYLEYVRKENFIPTGFNLMAANNHLLNTWLMKLCYPIFGINEMVLRLPNLLAHLLFVIYSAKLVRKLSSPIFIVCAFILLNFNPFMLDFFSLARGYGLSMGLMMASLYFSYLFVEGRNNYFKGFLSVLFAAIATLANVSLLNYFIIITGFSIFINSFGIRNKHSQNILSLIKENILILSPASILIFLIPIVLKEKNSGAFFFGGTNGFWKDAILSLITETVYERPLLMKLIVPIGIGVILILLVSLWILIIEIKENKQAWKSSFSFFTLFLLLFCFSANYIQFEWFKIPYPMERTALFYFPIFILLLAFVFNQFHRSHTKTTTGFIIGITTLFVFNFIVNANKNYVISWKSEADVNNMILYLMNNKKDVPAEKNCLNIGIHLTHESDINYYRNKYRLTWLNLADRNESMHPANDYFYLEKKNLSMLPKVKYRIVNEFPLTNTLLVSNEQEWNKKEIYHEKFNFDKPAEGEHFNNLSNDVSYEGTNSSKTDLEAPYSDGFNYKIDDSLLNNKTAMVIFKAMIYVEDLNADANLVISFENHSMPYFYIPMDIKDVVVTSKEWTPINFSVCVPKDIKKDDLLKCYLWNLGKYPVFIDEMELKIIAYEKL